MQNLEKISFGNGEGGQNDFFSRELYFFIRVHYVAVLLCRFSGRQKIREYRITRVLYLQVGEQISWSPLVPMRAKFWQMDGNLSVRAAAFLEPQVLSNFLTTKQNSTKPKNFELKFDLLF